VLTSTYDPLSARLTRLQLGTDLDLGYAYDDVGNVTVVTDTVLGVGSGDQADAQLGWSVGTAGDVNGDGYDDVIVGALYYDDAYTDEGRVSVYTGTVTGLSTMADWTRDGEQAEAHLGVSVGWAGDVNDDGFADVIVGADAYDNGQTNEGAAFIYTGTVSGLGATAEWMGESDQASALFGWAVGTAGDVNGDGCSDVIIGAYRYDDGESNEGRAFVYYGLPVDQVAVTTMRTIAYTYDPLDRLVSATGAVSESYEYDAIGNLTSKGGVSYGYQDGAHVHAVTHLGGVERFAYDINGNMTERTERGRDVRAGLRRRERLCTAARRIAVFAVR